MGNTLAAGASRTCMTVSELRAVSVIFNEQGASRTCMTFGCGA